MLVFQAPLAVLASLALLAAPARAHEDDPKLLDLQPPYAGAGLRTGAASRGSLFAQATQMPVFGSQSVTLLSWVSADDLETQGGNDCWGYVSPTGREYAIIGLRSGTAWVEISDPREPVVVANLPGPHSLWRDIKVWQHYAYSVSEGGGGIQVFDMSAIDQGVVAHLGNQTFGGMPLATHNVALDADSGFLYRCGGGSNGLRIYDLNADPVNPTFVGSWDTKYVHDTQVVTYGSGPGAQQIAFCCAGFNGGFNQTGLSIVDVTDKQNPVVLREVFWPNPGYSHQVWLSPDRRFAYLNDELDEDGAFPTTTYVFDVQNPSQASLVGSFTNGNSAIGHNLYTRGDLIFEANYRSGLRVFDATNPTAPSEVAYFDTYPDDDAASFNGLWSNFPYFPSGVVIGSDMERGLFVWWVGTQPLEIFPTAGVPPTLAPLGESMSVTLSEALPGSFAPGTAQLHYDTGPGLVSVPLTPSGDGEFTVAFPQIACGSQVRYYFSAEDTAGNVWYGPNNAAFAPYQAIAASGVHGVLEDPLEAASGWTAGLPGDTASSGTWVRVNPNGTPAQPEDDHTPSGAQCFVTGQGPAGGSIGESDVDGGSTTLLSPLYDLSSYVEPTIGYWRWYSNDQLASGINDVFKVDVNDGSGWVNVETIGPIGADTHGGWIHHEFMVSDYVAPGASVQLRFVAADFPPSSYVEAAIDDLSIGEFDCTNVPTTYCVPKVTSSICFASVNFTGSPSATGATPFTIGATAVNNAKSGVLFYGYANAAIPYQGGTLCVLPPLRRTSLQNSGGTPPPAQDCSGTFSFDFGALLASGLDPLLAPGASGFAQYWFRDPADASGFGTGLSDGLQFVIQP